MPYNTATPKPESPTTYCTFITPDVALSEALSSHIAQIEGMAMSRGLTSYPDTETAIRFFQTSLARIVFLDVRDGEPAFQIPSEMELRDPGLQFIAIGEPAQPDLSWRGIQERLSLPLDPSALSEAILRRRLVSNHLPRRFQKSTPFVSVLPAKPGSGASTLAAGLAHIASKQHKTLLFDLDLDSGTVGFRHNAGRFHALPDILAQAAHIDEKMWSQIITVSGDLHLIPIRMLRASHLDLAALDHLLDFLKTTYDLVIFDLSGSLQQHSWHVMNASSHVLMVSTSELDCLYVGRGKVEEIRDGGLGERLSILLNRTQKTNVLQRKDVEDLLRSPIKAEFPNDYKSVQESLKSGAALSPSSALSKALARYVDTLFENPRPVQAPKRFIEYFPVPFLNTARTFESGD